MNSNFPKYSVAKAFGCRSKDSKEKKGGWDGAWVAMKYRFENEPLRWKSVVFDRNMDFISHPKNFDEVAFMFSGFTSRFENWDIMEKEDIEKTTGTKLPEDTDLSFPYRIVYEAETKKIEKMKTKK